MGEEDLVEIKQQLAALQKSCEKMDRHIDFIEMVYEKLHAPLQWLLNKWHKTLQFLPYINSREFQKNDTCSIKWTRDDSSSF